MEITCAQRAATACAVNLLYYVDAVGWLLVAIFSKLMFALCIRSVRAHYPKKLPTQPRISAVTPIFPDHVVQNYARFHYLFDIITVPQACKVLQYEPARDKDAESELGVLSNALLTTCVDYVLVAMQLCDCFGKYCQFRVDAISQVVLPRPGTTTDGVRK